MKKITLLSLLFLTLFACRKDIEEQVTTPETPDPTTVILDYDPVVIEVNASLVGIVYDEAGAVIEDAQVSMGTYNTTTDDKGRFLFKDKTMNAAGTYVEVNKSGYFLGSTRLFPKEGSQNYTKITMLTRTSVGNFESANGGTLSSAEGIELSFPANSIVDADGNTYDGTVTVDARWLDPTADNLEAIMPGNLQGLNEDLEEVAMASFGMMAVELTGVSNEELNLGNGGKAELTFPVPAELVDNAPAEIPLWYFHETYGIWVQDGKATLVGNNYVGEVSHFSFWNCDAPFPLINLTGTIVSDAGNVVPNAIVKLQVVSSGACGFGWTDNNGVFTGKVPQGEEMILTVSQVYNGCEFLSTNVGPFDVDTDLGDIVATSAQLVNITGNLLDCNNDPLAEGWVEVTLGNQTAYYYVNGNSQFDLSIYNCEMATELTVTATNLVDLEVSDVYTYTVTNPLDLGDVSACGNVIDEYFRITVDGEEVLFIDVSAVDSLTETLLSGGIPGANSYFNLSFNGNTTGTYAPGDIGFFYAYLPTTTVGSGGPISFECGGTGCGFTELVITEYGAQGEKVKGYFSGQGEAYENQGNTLTVTYTGDFEIYLD